VAFEETVGGAFPVIAATLKFALAFAVLRAGRNHLFNVLFFALYFLSAVKSVAEGVLGYLTFKPGFITDAAWFPDPLWWIAIAYACLPLMLGLYVWFASVFPRPHNVFARSPHALAALFVPPLALLLLVLLYVFAPEAMPLSANTLTNLFNGVAFVYTVYALFVLFQAIRIAKDDIERHRTQLVFAALALVTVASWVLQGLHWMGAAFETQFLLFWAPPVEIVECAVIAYAILKYQLLGVELIAKATVKQTFTVGSLGVVFFVTKGTLEEVFEALFNTEVNYLIGAVVTGVLFLPVEKLSRKVVTKFFPGVEESEDYLRKRKLEIYREQLAVAVADGELKEKELKMLSLLRQTLGLTEDEAQRIEREVNPFLSGVVAATPAQPAPK